MTTCSFVQSSKVWYVHLFGKMNGVHSAPSTRPFLVFDISEVKSHIDLQFRFRYPRFGSRRSLEYKSGSFPHLLTPGNLPQEYLNSTQNQLKGVEMDVETPSWIRLSRFPGTTAGTIVMETYD